LKSKKLPVVGAQRNLNVLPVSGEKNEPANGGFVSNSVEKVDPPERDEISFQFISSVCNIDSSSRATGCNRFCSTQ